MRLGTLIFDVYDALTNPVEVGAAKTMPTGDVRQRYCRKRASVAVSITDKR